MDSFTAILLTLIVIAVSHKLLNDYLTEQSRNFHHSLHFAPQEIQPRNTVPTFATPYSYDEDDEDVEEEDLSPLSPSDMKSALQSYLDTQLQQNSPKDVTIDNQYDILYNKDKGAEKVEQTPNPTAASGNSVPSGGGLDENLGGPEDWGNSIQPYMGMDMGMGMGNHGNFATF